MEPIRLYMLQTGTLKCKVHNIKMNQGDAPYEIPVPFFLLMHPEGNVLIDGGNSIEAATDPKGYWGAITDIYWPVMQETEGCVMQLGNLGVRPEDIRYVIQSHLHLDHTGAIGRFPNATHIVQKREYDYAFSPDWFSAGGYVRQDFDRLGLKWRFLDAKDEDFLDLYGDGVLTIVSTPGHSEGHQSFLIKLPNSGPILLTIDAAYTFDHWNERALPGFLTSAIDTVRSVRKLRALAEATGAKVVTGHDPEAWKDLKKAPDYYD